ncbi:MAG TPA: lysylphosphatidylglycerol synthase domain-containing protein [Acetobacteraceae bacterium]|nr:lysylphosphatidylglycerol synthase domain-containing protein [Acetobacteraceae bacterium]
MKTKTLSFAAALAGLALGTALVGWFGFHRVLAGVLKVGIGGLALLVLCQGALFVILGFAWWTLMPERPAVRVLIWARMVRDAAANCLPLSTVGGFVLGARAATLHGVVWQMASASTVADVTSEFLTQLVFAAAGLGVLVTLNPGSHLALPFGIGIAFGLLGGAAFVAAQRGVASFARRLARHVKARWITAAVARIELLQGALMPIYRRPGRYSAASALHLLGWIASGVGGWLIMRLAGASIGLPAALAIEGLLQVSLTAAFAVPGFAGVQEAAYIGLGSAFGLTPDIAIAVSLVRRARDVLVGVPILLVWQLIEARRLQPASSIEKRAREQGDLPSSRSRPSQSP